MPGGRKGKRLLRRVQEGGDHRIEASKPVVDRGRSLRHARSPGSSPPGASPNGVQARWAGCRHDFSENSTSDAAIKPEPRKKVRSMTKCKSATQCDSPNDMKAVRAGTRLRNMVTKPLSPPVTVKAI